MNKTRELDLINGPVKRTLIRFTLPFLLANLLQTLYGMVDLIVVGKFSDAANMSAVSIGSVVFGTMTLLVIGLTTGGTVLIGQYLGAGYRKDAETTTATMFTLYPLFAIGFMGVLLLISGPLLKLLNTPEEAYPHALAYVRVCTFGLIFTTGYNAIAATLRGMGDSKTPLFFVAVACVFNIIGDVVLAGWCKLGALGAGLATTLGQALSMIIGIVYLRHHDFLFDFRLKSFRISKEKAKKLIRLGVPLSMQEALITLSFLIIEAVINKMGVTASAGAGIGDKLFNIAVIPSGAFAASIASMGAQNLGADRPDRVHECMKTGLVCSFLIALAFYAWAQFAPLSIGFIFTTDPEVAKQAADYMKFYSLDFVLCSIVFPLNGLFNAAGRTKFTLVNNLIATFGIRLPLLFLMVNLVANATLVHVGLALPVATIVQLIIVIVYYKVGRWKTNVVLDK